MNKLKGANKTKRGLSIDDLDTSLTPSLVGYWKCNEGNGDTILDYSGNDYHLTVGNSYEMSNWSGGAQTGNQSAIDANARWNEHPGYVAFGWGMGAFIEIANAPLLNTGSNFLIFGCEVTYHADVTDDLPNEGVDFDLGTYWAGNPGVDTPGTIWTDHWKPAQGYNLLALGVANAENNLFGGRVANDAEGKVESIRLDSSPRKPYPYKTYLNANEVNDAMPQENNTLILGYDPSTSIYCGSHPEGVDEQEIITYSDDDGSTILIPSTLPPQEMEGVPLFGLRCQNNFHQRWGLKKVHVWSFDVAPQYGIEQTLRWMTRNHGRIPSWLVGK